jgi:hypothetical protein
VKYPSPVQKCHIIFSYGISFKDYLWARLRLG